MIMSDKSINASRTVETQYFGSDSDGRAVVLAEIRKQKRNALYYQGKNKAGPGVNSQESTERQIL